MNKLLVVCSQCKNIKGCKEPAEYDCDTCVTHNCPTLPTAVSHGLCLKCATALLERNTRPLAQWQKYT